MRVPFLLLMILAATIWAGDVGAQHDHDSQTEEKKHDEHGDEDGEHGDEHDEHSEGVKLTAAELEEFGVELAEAGPGVIELYLSLPGEVRPNADRLAHIVPRFSGIVTAVHANLGDRVRGGQALATIESDESLAPFEVQTLISGTVIAKHIALGEAVSRDKDIYVIADLSSVWVDVTLYQQDLGSVHKGQRVTIFVGHAESRDSGTISYITPVVDEATRTATARVVLPNQDNLWRPGMFITAKVITESADVRVAIPTTALQTLNGETVVFVESEGMFVPRDVTIGRAGESFVEVVDGLEPGERYVRKGGFIIKAELGKEAFGDGHGH